MKSKKSLPFCMFGYKIKYITILNIKLFTYPSNLTYKLSFFVKEFSDCFMHFIFSITLLLIFKFSKISKSPNSFCLLSILLFLFIKLLFI